ncbi:hypothetical protein EB796_018841 [Bugula neritina]|uniref:Uncharacterized protein n=1 Tax=Bugula neritina TaxID=10212 RepID=A0A7J7J9F4_BUGNE|nr:hypothetical protein EB796_018841 [Bugula neritina]
MVMLTLFVFCFIHGLFVGIIYPLQRVYRYKMSSSMCILTTLLMDFADNYILVLLPVFPQNVSCILSTQVWLRGV